MRGRPRKFDRDEALTKAMEVFWAKGYEATQLADLNRAIGINSPSFYATFKGKEQIFLEALERYRADVGEVTLRVLDSASSAHDAVLAMLVRTIDVILSGEQRRGCMVMLGVAGGDPAVHHLHELLRDTRVLTVERIRARLQRGIEDGDLAVSTDISALASYYGMVLQGLSLQARDGASRNTLERTVHLAMAPLAVGVAERKM